MQKLKLNDGCEYTVGFNLDAKNEYIIDMRDELAQQKGILGAIESTDSDILYDYHEWLKSTKFDLYNTNMIKDKVNEYFGKKPLWMTEESQGIIVKEAYSKGYCIVMEVHDERGALKYNQIVVNMI